MCVCVSIHVNTNAYTIRYMPKRKMPSVRCKGPRWIVSQVEVTFSHPCSVSVYNGSESCTTKLEKRLTRMKQRLMTRRHTGMHAHTRTYSILLTTSSHTLALFLPPLHTPTPFSSRSLSNTFSLSVHALSGSRALSPAHTRSTFFATLTNSPARLLPAEPAGSATEGPCCTQRHTSVLPAVDAVDSANLAIPSRRNAVCVRVYRTPWRRCNRARCALKRRGGRCAQDSPAKCAVTPAGSLGQSASCARYPPLVQPTQCVVRVHV